MSETSTASTGGWSLTKLFFLGTAASFAASVGLRMAMSHPHSPKPNPVPSSARSLVNDVAGEVPAAQSWLETILPYVTEASLFGLLGFAVGYTSRKLLRWAVVLLGIGFVVLLVLAAQGKADVNVSQVVKTIDQWILNAHWDVSLPEFVKHRVPTVVMFAIGWFVGLRKG